MVNFVLGKSLTCLNSQKALPQLPLLQGPDRSFSPTPPPRGPELLRFQAFENPTCNGFTFS